MVIQSRHHGYCLELLSKYVTFFTQKTFVRLVAGERSVGFSSDAPAGWSELAVPDDADVRHGFDQLFISLRSNWLGGNGVVYAAGSLLAVNVVDFIKAGMEGTFM
jgi:dihydrodipicolinate synthase/N-acetylneuraminate lyase